VKYIVSSTTGIDHITASRNIKIIHLDPSEILEVSATAEFTLALLLSLIRKIPFIDADNVGNRLAYRGTQLRGRKLGIFGMGRLGRRMARYAEALDMVWLGYDLDSKAERKTEILKTCDVIFATPLSRGEFGKAAWNPRYWWARPTFALGCSSCILW